MVRKFTSKTGGCINRRKHVPPLLKYSPCRPRIDLSASLGLLAAAINCASLSQTLKQATWKMLKSERRRPMQALVRVVDQEARSQSGQIRRLNVRPKRGLKRGQKSTPEDEKSRKTSKSESKKSPKKGSKMEPKNGVQKSTERDLAKKSTNVEPA
jgi:hypothetical protein